MQTEGRTRGMQAGEKRERKGDILNFWAIHLLQTDRYGHQLSLALSL